MSFESVVTESGQFVYDNFHFSEATKSNGFLLCSGVIGITELAIPGAHVEIRVIAKLKG